MARNLPISLRGNAAQCLQTSLGVSSLTGREKIVTYNVKRLNLLLLTSTNRAQKLPQHSEDKQLDHEENQTLAENEG